MFYYLKGKPALKGENFAVIDVGGAGYKVYTSSSTLSKIGCEVITLYTYMHLREDIMDIYGFITVDELNFFENLISVSGVGPKAALAILSTHSPSDMIFAVMAGDAKKISKAPGVGPKLAQRIILELKDKIKGIEIGESTESFSRCDSSEAVSALIVLGYSPQEAAAAVSKIDGIRTVEETIKEALKILMR